MAEQNHERKILIGILLVAAIFAVYLPVIWLGFINYDDPGYILENAPVLDGVNWESFKWAFTHSHSANWHPVTWLSHMLDCQFYGLRPAGHHLTSLFLHSVNTLLVFQLLNTLTRSFWCTACVAALFGLHPLHVESVAWISERKDVLSAFFGLLCLLAYVRYAEGRKERAEGREDRTEVRGQKSEGRGLGASRHFPPLLFYLLALVFFALGLMSKPMLVTWPCVMFLMDYWPLRRFRLRSTGAETQKSDGAGRIRTLLLEKAPFFVLSAAACAITVISQKNAEAIAPLAEAPLMARIANAVLAYFRYITKIFWPTNLSVIYLDAGKAPLVMLIPAIVLLAAITWFTWRWRKTRPYFLMGWCWFLGTLVPVIGLVKVGNQSMADRYTYLPAIGLFIMFAWGIADLITTKPASRTRLALGLAAAAVFSACSLLAQRQVMFWQNTETLFRHALAVTGKNYVAYNSLGFYLADLGEWKEAERVLRTSLAIHPNSAPAWNKLASLLINEGRYEEAKADCEIALRLKPRMAEAHTTSALALLKQGKTNDALLRYSEALTVQPDNAPAHYNLANALARLGQFDQAREHYEASLRSDPRSADAHNNLAYILAREQKFDEAIAHFRLALRFEPQSWQAHYGLAEALTKRNRLPEAATEFSEVLRLKPDLAMGHFQLAVTLLRLGRLNEARLSAEQARLLATRTGQEELARRSQQLLDRLQSR